MRVAHIIDSLGLGGAQTVVKGILESQNSNKDVFLYVLNKREVEIKVNHPNSIQFESKSKFALSPLLKLRESIKINKIEVLHCHLFKSQFFGFLLKKFFFPKIKLIQHEHGKIFKNQFIYNTFIKTSRNETNLFLAVSKAVKKELIKNGKVSKEKIKVLYNFVNLDKFNRKNITWNIRKEKKKLGLKKEEFVIGFAGRLSEEKGCEYLIKALPYLDFKYKCLIAGDGGLKEKLEKLAKKLNVEDKLIFLGYQQNILKFYSIIDVLIVPSLIESFGLSAIEAQAMSVPVIASNLPALNELIQNKNNGILFKTKDSLNLSKKIELMYENKKLEKKIIKNGLKNSGKRDLKNYLISLNKVYVKIVNKANKRSLLK